MKSMNITVNAAIGNANTQRKLNKSEIDTAMMPTQRAHCARTKIAMPARKTMMPQISTIQPQVSRLP